MPSTFIDQRKYWNQSLVAEQNLFTINLDKPAGNCRCQLIVFMLPAQSIVRKLYFYELAFNMTSKCENVWQDVRRDQFSSIETGTTYGQIVVKRGNLKLLIVSPQDNTGLSDYVISVRKTSVVGRNKRELKVMKSFKYKFSSDSCRS